MSTPQPAPEQSTPAPVASRPAPPPSSSSKSQRVLACVLCQQRKVKCDRRFPCANCTKHNVQCVPATQARRRRRRFPERELLDRLQRYEDLLRQNHVRFEPLHKGTDAIAAARDKDTPEGRYESDEEFHDAGVTDASTPSTPSRAKSAYETK